MPYASRTVNKKQLTINQKVKSHQFPSKKDASLEETVNGFTLVELLVGMAILGIISAATLLFLSSMFRGSNQANVVSSLKQNGQVVLNSLERQIRNATERLYTRHGARTLGEVLDAHQITSRPPFEAIAAATWPAVRTIYGLPALEQWRLALIDEFLALP